MIRGVVAAVVRGLLADGELILEEGASADALIDEVLGRLPRQGAFAQLGSFLGGALLSAPQVAELYASNEALIERVNAVEL
jgi:hypothetical protein